jgi:hypothetical protein
MHPTATTLSLPARTTPARTHRTSARDAAARLRRRSIARQHWVDGCLAFLAHPGAAPRPRQDPPTSAA